MTRPPQRATRWRLRTQELHFGSVPLLMGIVNVTPDSFSDGGLFSDAQRAVDHGLRLAAEGAAILDVGGESTRPYATAVPESEELQRAIPVVRALCKQASVPVSIDTTKARVAQAAIDAGAEIINDVTGLEGDPQMLPLALTSGAGVCAMHMQGTPQTMQDAPTYKNVVSDVFAYLQQRRDALLQAGISLERICLDAGIGFGKTHQHNLQLLSSCYQFHQLGCALLVGHSRKGFIAHLTRDKEGDRTPGSIGVALSLARQGVQVLRVHDIQPVRHALMLFEATGGMSELR